MEAIKAVHGRAAPLARSNVDTDQIIPAKWLKRVERTGFGQGLFSEWRKDPSFVLNRPEYAGATILVAGANFGAGSSREHAVWALLDWGFRAVVAASFADIFRANCAKAGLLAASVGEPAEAAVLAAVAGDPTLTLTADVESRLVLVPGAGIEVPFALDDFTRRRFLEGLDDIGLTTCHVDAIEAYERRRPPWLPSTAHVLLS